MDSVAAFPWLTEACERRAHGAAQAFLDTGRGTMPSALGCASGYALLGEGELSLLRLRSNSRSGGALLEGRRRRGLKFETLRRLGMR
jgi:hypothetical protein